MASLYWVDDPADLQVPVGEIVAITGAEARHAAQVARLRVGESVALGDGEGTVATAVATAVGRERVEVRIESVSTLSRPALTMTLIQGLAKGDRAERAIQAAVELGVDRVVPWAARRSVSRWEGAKVERGRERWETIGREAAKQSIRAWAPRIEPLVTTREIAERAATVLVLEPSAELSLTQWASSPEGAAAIASEGELALVVGPEGGIAPEELDRLAASGATAIRLGSEVLRTSTAGPAALSALAVLAGRW